MGSGPPYCGDGLFGRHLANYSSKFSTFSQTTLFPSKHSKNHPQILKHLLDQGLQPNEAIFRLNEIFARHLRKSAENVRKTRHLP